MTGGRAEARRGSSRGASRHVLRQGTQSSRLTFSHAPDGTAALNAQERVGLGAAQARLAADAGVGLRARFGTGQPCHTAGCPPAGGCPTGCQGLTWRQLNRVPHICTCDTRFSDVPIDTRTLRSGAVDDLGLQHLLHCSGGCMRRHMPPDSQQDPQPFAVAVVLALLKRLPVLLSHAQTGQLAAICHGYSQSTTLRTTEQPLSVSVPLQAVIASNSRGAILRPVGWGGGTSGSRILPLQLVMRDTPMQCNRDNAERLCSRG